MAAKAKAKTEVKEVVTEKDDLSSFATASALERLKREVTLQGRMLYLICKREHIDPNKLRREAEVSLATETE